MRVPATGEGISVSTLSVDTSRSASSTATLSPTLFNHRVTVPSVTLSPRAGIEIIVPLAGAAGACATGAAGACATGAAATGAAGACITGAAATGAVATGVAPSSMSARSAPTATVESMGTSILERVPATGDGISVSTLSVDTSRSGSSTLM